MGITGGRADSNGCIGGRDGPRGIPVDSVAVGIGNSVPGEGELAVDSGGLQARWVGEGVVVSVDDPPNALSFEPHPARRVSNINRPSRFFTNDNMKKLPLKQILITETSEYTLSDYPCCRQTQHKGALFWPSLKALLKDTNDTLSDEGKALSFEAVLMVAASDGEFTQE